MKQPYLSIPRKVGVPNRYPIVAIYFNVLGITAVDIAFGRSDKYLFEVMDEDPTKFQGQLNKELIGTIEWKK